MNQVTIVDNIKRAPFLKGLLLQLLLIRLGPLPNREPTKVIEAGFYRRDALPVAQPTVSITGGYSKH